MSAAWTLDRRLTAGVVVAVIAQIVAMSIWVGGASERLSSLESREGQTLIDHVRLARLETRLEQIERQLDRIATRLEVKP